MKLEMVEVAAPAPLFIFDFGNQQNREKLRQAQVDRAMVVSLRYGCCMHKPAVDGIALLRADGELAVSVSVGTAKEVWTWAYNEVLDAMDYFEAN